MKNKEDASKIKQHKPVFGDPMAEGACLPINRNKICTPPPYGREGDFGFDIPEAGPIQGRVMGEDEIRQLEAEKAANQEQAYLEELEKLRGTFSFFSVSPWLRNLLTYPVILFLAFIGMVTIAQTATGIAGIFTLPSPLSWLMGGLLTLLGTIVLLICARLCVMLLRLRKTDAWEIAAHQQLGERVALQESARHHKHESVLKLCAYLDRYDLDTKEQKELEMLYLKRDSIQCLIEGREYLLQNRDALEAGEWIQEFQNRFQSYLDVAANELVKQISKKTAISTACSPDPLLDRIIVLGMTMSMVTQLLKLYGLRPSLLGAASLLATAFSISYLASAAEKVSEEFSDEVTNLFIEQTGQAVKKALSSIGSKLGEAGINYLLVRRLGKAAISKIQPTHY